jgi:hypothetical protein
MTTVGYGDLYVTTPIGIGLDGLLMFSGVVIVSLLVSSLNGLFTLGYSNYFFIVRIKTRANTAETTQRQKLAQRNGKHLHRPLPLTSMALKENRTQDSSLIRGKSLLPDVQPTPDDSQVRKIKATQPLQRHAQPVRIFETPTRRTHGHL